MELPDGGALLPRSDAIVAWHSDPVVPLPEAVAHVRDKAPVPRV